jgi:hypothetical protein
MNVEEQVNFEHLQDSIERWKAFCFVLIVGALLIAGWSIWEYNQPTFNLNELGDFLGGVVGPLFSLAGLIIIYVAFLGQKQQLLLQQQELKATREELAGQRKQLELQNRQTKKRNYENTFFRVITLQNEIVDGLHLKDRYGVANLTIPSGDEMIYEPPDIKDIDFRASLGGQERQTYVQRDAFPILRRLVECFIYDVWSFKMGGEYIFSRDPRRVSDSGLGYLRLYLKNEAEKEEKRKLIQDGFDKFWEDKKYSPHHKLGHYFRTIAQLIALIQTLDVNQGLYVDQLLSQMSDEEINLLAYYGLSNQGQEIKEAITELKLVHPVASEYELVKHFLDLYGE